MDSEPRDQTPERTGADENGRSTAVEVPDDEKAALLNLLRATDVGVKTVRRLIERFDSAMMALSADDSTLESVGGLGREQIRTLREAEGEDFGGRELERVRALGGRVIVRGEGEYPLPLAKSPDPPVILYLLGKPLPVDGRAVAVVGRRKASAPGLELSHQIGAGLVRGGVAVVSGMALGIDSAAHRGALQEGGHTVAMFGCGLDVVYPRQHRKLYDQIVREGTLVSELFLGSAPEAKHFPMRNRIIAWTCSGTVVVEAPAKSGALITANYALQDGREVFAVPGHPLSPGHEGCNYLLRQGATPVRHAGDILEDLSPLLGLLPSAEQQALPLDAAPKGLDEVERKIFERLDPVEKVHADRLADELEIDTSRLGATLLGLELRGYVVRLPGDQYLRKSPGSWS